MLDKNRYTSLELAKKLQEVGFNKKTDVVWQRLVDHDGNVLVDWELVPLLTTEWLGIESVLAYDLFWDILKNLHNLGLNRKEAESFFTELLEDNNETANEILLNNLK